MIAERSTEDTEKISHVQSPQSLTTVRPDGDQVCLFSLALIAGTSPQKSISARREQVLFSMAIGNGELMHECFPKHPRMGTAR